MIKLSWSPSAANATMSPPDSWKLCWAVWHWDVSRRSLKGQEVKLIIFRQKELKKNQYVQFSHTLCVCVDLQLFVYKPRLRAHPCEWPSPPFSWPSLPIKFDSQRVYCRSKDTSKEMTVIVWMAKKLTDTNWMVFCYLLSAWHVLPIGDVVFALCRSLFSDKVRGSWAEGGVASFGPHCPHWLTCIP